MIRSPADIGALLEAAARKHGQRVALSDPHRTQTFSQVDQRTNRLANAIRALDPHHRPVALMLSNRNEFIEADLALIKSGGAKVPINLRLSELERSHIVEDSGASILITEAAHADEANSLRNAVDALEHVVVVDAPPNSGLGYEDLIAEASAERGRRPWRPDDPSVILYTSGTTGKPKGATASFRTRLSATKNMLLDELNIDPGDGLLHAGPLSHGSGSKSLAFFLSGARNILMPKFEPEVFLRTQESQKATVTFMVPTMISMLVDAVESGRYDLSTMKQISYGGAPISPALIARAIDALGPILVQVYGSAEAPHPLTVLTAADHMKGLDDQSSLLTSAGRPATAVEVAIESDGDDGLGVGEIMIRSDSIMTGYWNNPEATSEVFDEGFYRMGDLGVVDDNGYLHILDRKRDLVISGGLNVYPAEVEAALKQLPGIADAAVIGIPDEKWGELVTAFVVARPGCVIDETQVAADTAAQLAGYKRPRLIATVDALPRGATGKVLKTELRKPFWGDRARQVN